MTEPSTVLVVGGGHFILARRTPPCPGAVPGTWQDAEADGDPRMNTECFPLPSRLDTAPWTKLKSINFKK